jgi:hypothetical protein
VRFWAIAAEEIREPMILLLLGSGRCSVDGLVACFRDLPLA